MFDDTIKSLEQRLRPLGFQPRGTGRFVFDLRPGCVGILQLFRASYPPEGFEINPIIEVRHVEIQRLIEECLGGVPNSKWVPTIRTNVGYLTPERRFLGWNFKVGDESGLTSDNLIDVIAKYGVPFLTQHNSVDGIIEGIRAGYGGPTVDRVLRIAAAEWLLGRHQNALAVITAEIQQRESSADGELDLLKRFAEGLNAKYSFPSSG